MCIEVWRFGQRPLTFWTQLKFNITWHSTYVEQLSFLFVHWQQQIVNPLGRESIFCFRMPNRITPANPLDDIKRGIIVNPSFQAPLNICCFRVDGFPNMFTAGQETICLISCGDQKSRDPKPYVVIDQDPRILVEKQPAESLCTLFFMSGKV